MEAGLTAQRGTQMGVRPKACGKVTWGGGAENSVRYPYDGQTESLWESNMGRQGLQLSAKPTALMMVRPKASENVTWQGGA